MRGRLPSRLRLAFCALVVCWPAAPASAEIVVLDNGRFLKADSYEVEGDDVRIGLEAGGELVMPLLRIDRVVADEITADAEARAYELETAPPLALGFEDDHEVPDTPYGEEIFNVARRRNVNPRLVAAIMRAESAFDPLAVSRKGARGLMQLMPATGKRFGVTPNELFDAAINIEAGVTYLGELIRRYSADLPLVLAAYNAGEGAVDRHHGVPPYRETQDYIRRIYSFLGVSAVSSDSPGK